MESDAWSFERLAGEYEGETDVRKKAVLCEKACELYRGEFLPQLSNEQWVIQKNRYYQKLYFEMAKYLLKYWKEKGDYQNMERLAAHAAALYPFGEWEIWRIDSLIALGRSGEAAEVYRRAAERMQGLGDSASKKTLAQLRRIGARLRQPEGTKEAIYSCLKEETPEPGAYCCTIPGFADCFHMLKRVGKREEVPFSLLLCTILDADGHPMDNRERCEKQGEKLKATFRTHLRSGDIYVKYNASQYLLLCVGVGRENVPEIGGRIDADFRRRCGGRGGIRCHLLEDG